MGEPRAFLNGLIAELFRRTTQAPEDREAYLGRTLVVETPDEAAIVLDNPDLFAKNFAQVSAFGPSRFNLNGAAWQQIRPRTQRAYAQMGRPLMQVEIARFYADELDASVADAAGLEAALARAALTVFFAAFGVRPDVSPFLAHFAELRDIAADLQLQSWIGNELEMKDDARLRAAKALATFQGLIAAQPQLARMLTELAETAPKLQPEVMAADFMTNMLAGIETTTASIGWMVDAIGRNGELQDALRADALRADALGDGALLSSFRDECLRVFAPIPFVIREATAPTRLGSRQLAAGDLVLLSLVGLHRDPTAWKTPHEFHARRADFAPGAPPNPAFRPFLSGPRVCGGRRIAEMETTVALRAMLARFSFESPNEPPSFVYALAFRPVLTPAHRLARRA